MLKNREVANAKSNIFKETSEQNFERKDTPRNEGYG